MREKQKNNIFDHLVYLRSRFGEYYCKVQQRSISTRGNKSPEDTAPFAGVFEPLPFAGTLEPFAYTLEPLVSTGCGAMCGE